MCCTLLTRWSALVLKVGVLYGWRLKEDWLIMLRKQLQPKTTLYHC